MGLRRSSSRPRAVRKRAALLSISLLCGLLVGYPGPVRAAGTPDIAMSVEAPEQILLGETVTVRLKATNAAGPDGYNTSYRMVVPAGFTVVPGSGTPLSPEVIDHSNGTKTLLWLNASDSLTGATSEVTVDLVAGSDTGPVTFQADAYTHDDARQVPQFNTWGNVVPGSYTGSDNGSDTVALVPFRITGDVRRPENEIPRGVQDFKTVVDLRVENNHIGSSSDLEIVDYLPASLEFLGCGDTDNSATGTEEYTGAGRIDSTPAPAMTNPCIAPSSVETVTEDPPGPLPHGVYTKITWDSAALTPTRANPGAGEDYTISYVTGVPRFANTDPGAPATANLDNNNGPSTIETTEQQVTNYVAATGTYSGTSHQADDEEILTLEDLSVQQTVSPGTIEQGGTSTWTLDLQVSEYTTSTADTVVEVTVPDGLEVDTNSLTDGGAAVVNGDGTTTITWNLGSTLAGNSTKQLTYQTITRNTYRGSGRPVLTGDSWTSDAKVTATLTDLNGETRTVRDESNTSQKADGASLTKEVAAPVSADGTCGDGSALSWEPEKSSTAFHPDDYVCWRLTTTNPANLDSGGVAIVDLLPPGHTFDADGTNEWQVGSQSGVQLTRTAADPGRVSWEPTGGNLANGKVAQVVFRTRITDVDTVRGEDVNSNLVKVTYRNSDGTAFQLRDHADADYDEPTVEVNKSASLTDVKAGSVVDYTVTVTNTGPVDLVNAQVWDLLPTHLTCSDVTTLPAGYTCIDAGRDRLEGTIAALAAGATETITYQVTMPQDVRAGERFDNKAGLRSYGTETNHGVDFTHYPADNVDPAVTPNAPAAQATAQTRVGTPTMSKDRTTALDEAGNAGAGQATIGERVTYTVEASLPSGSILAGTTLTDPIPEGMTLTGAPALTLDGNPAPAFTVDTSGDELVVKFPDPYTVPAAGTSHQLVVRYDAIVDDTAGNTHGKTLTNTATLAWQKRDGGTDTVRASSNTTVVEPAPQVTKTEADADDLVTPGESIDFTVTASNGAGRPPAHDVVVVDTVPAAYQPVNGGVLVADGGTVGSGGVWNATARTITWTQTEVPALAGIAGGATVPLPYQVRVLDVLPVGNSFTNRVDLQATSAPGATAGERNYTAADSVTLGGPQLGVTKSGSPASAAVGQTVDFTVQATIPADVESFDTVVTDTLPAGLRLVAGSTSSSCSPGGCTLTATGLAADGNNIGWHIGDIAAETQPRVLTIHYQAVVTDEPAVKKGTTLTNQASVRANRTDKVSTDPTAVADLGTFDENVGPARADTDVTEPTVTVDKNVDGEGPVDDVRRVVSGEEVTYSITVANSGNSTAYDLAVTDAVDSRLTAVSIADGTDNGMSWTVTDADPSDGTLAFAIAELPAGASMTISYTMQVPTLTRADEVVAGPELENTADGSYFSRPAADTGRRRYDDITPDVVGLEADVAAVGDLVWFDADNDGIQDPGEPGLSGIEVEVVYLGPDGVPGGGDDKTYTTTTDSTGKWKVDGLPGGEYTTRIVSALPDGTRFGTDPDGGQDGTTRYTLAEDADRTNIDFAVTGTQSVGDLVWYDRNRDGVQDAGEPGLAGVDVTVRSGGQDGTLGTADDLTWTVTTGADGSWTVPNVPAGPVQVEIDQATLPDGARPVSDPDDTADGRYTGAVSAGTDLTNLDFGVAGTGSVGDRVWVDRNNDGNQDPGEPGIPGTRIEVRWAGSNGIAGDADDLVAEVTTGADGSYLVDGLPQGEVTVTVVGGPAGLTASYDEDDGTTSPDGSTTVNLGDGESHLTADFGYRSDTAVGDRIWLDRNGDGVQDDGEPGLPGVEVTVTSAGTNGVLGDSDDVVFTTTTDENGHWMVGRLPEGPVRVEVTDGLPAGVRQTFDNDGTDTADSSQVTLNNGDVNEEQDFGYAGSNSIGDLVWADVNGDGTQDAGEPGLSGVTVQVTFLGADGKLGTADDVVITTQTGDDGSYLVDGLPDGDYEVRVISGVPDGYTPGADEDGGQDATAIITGLSGGQTHDTADFGYLGEGTLAGKIWFDRNADGQTGTAEPATAGVELTVTWGGPDGVVGTDDDVTLSTTTAADGTWSVDGLPPGEYQVDVVQDTLPPDTRIVFSRDEGSTEPNGTWSGTLDPAGEILNIDHGIAGSAQLTETVFWDKDGDGVLDGSEAREPDAPVTVIWHGPDGKAGTDDDVVFTTRTGSDGSISLTGLPAGQYSVEITAPDGEVHRKTAVLPAQGRVDLFTPLPVPATDGDGQPAAAEQKPRSGRTWIPYTGADVARTGLAGLILIGVGALLVRRRGSKRD